MSGAGVDVLHASAGTGKTSAVLGSVRQAYEAAGYRVVGAATSAKAARVLADDGGLQASTIARLLLDLERPQGGGIGPRTVLILDEASMIGTRDLERCCSTPSGPAPRSSSSATPDSWPPSTPAADSAPCRTGSAPPR